MLNKFIRILIFNQYIRTQVDETKSSANPSLHTQYPDGIAYRLSFGKHVKQLSMLLHVSQLQ